MTQIKFCGITRVEDALAAVKLGVNYLGFNFFPQSKRFIQPAAAAAITRSLPPTVERVGVFVNEEPEKVKLIARQTALSLLQFHGDEDLDYLKQFSEWPVIKAVRLKTSADIVTAQSFAKTCEFLLLDAFSAGEFGGTGKTIEEPLLEEFKSSGLFAKTFLAGGLNPENVAAKVSRFKPYAVDVAGGIESAPGVKDLKLMNEFVVNCPMPSL